MSSPSPLQCLFCNHLNPGGASFCNDCGSQLHLQQCDLCGSINKRTARICYKCGATFTYVGSTNAPSIPPGSAAHVINELQQRSLAEGSDVLEYDAGFDARETIRQSPLGANLPAESLPEDRTNFSERAPAAIVSRYCYPFAVSALVLAVIVLSVYYYREFSRQGSQEQRVERVAPALSGDSVFSGTTPSPLAVPGEAESGQAGRMKKYVLRVLGFGPQASSPPSPPPADADVALKTPTLPLADSESSPTECQEAVATLGLCTSIKRGEMH